MMARRILWNVAAASIYDIQCCLLSKTPLWQPHSCGLVISPLSQNYSSGFRTLSYLDSVKCPNTCFRESRPSSFSNGLFSHLATFGRFSSSATAPNVAIKCWACGLEAPDGPFLVCPSCKAVQPLDSSVNYFQIFNLEQGYDADAKDLERKYKDWQKKLHPDLFQNKSEQEREHSAQQSTQVIKAYRTLLKPLSRAEYLLQLQGIHVDEERTVTDPELLMEIMEIRESVENAKDLDALKSIQTQMQTKLEQCQKLFADAYKKQDFRAAVSVVQRMSYYERVIEEIIKKL